MSPSCGNYLFVNKITIDAIGGANPKSFFLLMFA
jgi:hypothetical protein